MQIVLSDFQDQLVRGLSHRMNNILSLFHGYLGLLMDDRKLDPVSREGLKKIRDGARAASELMERTNAISRPASAVRREVNLADFFRQLAPTFEELRRPKVRITVECPENLPRVCLDPPRFKLAIVELIRNACEAATSTVIIRVTETVDSLQTELFPGRFPGVPAASVTVTIADDGAGVPVAEANRIYEPFYTTKKARTSAGLGLTVALGCAQQFGGSLSHRRQERHTMFEMVLPARLHGELSAAA
jgi:signal transduction histidine kinase